MDLGLAGRAALITGGSKGIGFAAAESLAQAGCDIHLAARTHTDLQAAQARLIETYKIRVEIHPTDLSGGDAARALVEQCRDVDVLVNNAGAIPGGDIHAVTEEQWRDAWNLKVFGYQNMCRAMLSHMQTRGSGVVINIIGVAGEAHSPGYIAGTAGNASLMAMTRALGATSSTHGVRVIGINPGLIATERMTTRLRARAEKELGDAGKWQDLIDKTYPPGQAAHIGDMVAFLASDRSANTTGTIITIDGGSAARGNRV